MLFSSLLPYAEYAINYHYIAEQLCENKDKPALQCHGKCHLKKQVAKTITKSQKGNAENTIPVTLNDFYPSILYRLVYALRLPITATFKITQVADLYSYKPLHYLLKPPPFLF